MKKISIVASAVALVAVMSGCVSMSPEEQREAYAKEFNRLSSLPPAERVHSPNREISRCAMLSCDLFNEVHPLMKAYVAAVESSREYTGFMDDIRYYVDEKKMSNQEACKKVYNDVVAADANLPADQKMWPKIQKGILAANELDPKKQLAKIALLVARNAEIVKSVSNLPNAFKNEDMMGKINRGAECTAISNQLAESLECLTFLGDQYSRVIELEAFAK